MTTVWVNYALAPHVTLDDIVRQARWALAWVTHNIADYGGDSSRIVVGGHSAGGQIAAMCLLTEWALNYGIDPSIFRGGLPLSGLFDLERFSFLQPQLQLDSGIVERCSPIRHVRAGLPPILLAVGETESAEFHCRSDAFRAIAAAAGNQAERIDIDGADHFSVVEALLDPTSHLSNWVASRA